jgi:hypothetical protein
MRRSIPLIADSIVIIKMPLGRLLFTFSTFLSKICGNITF